MTFDLLKKKGRWEPIRDCPGRFVLRDVIPDLSIHELLGDNTTVEQLHSRKAKDLVWVARFADGGTISYARSDGTWLHTLNTNEGLRRKLEQLLGDED